MTGNDADVGRAGADGPWVLFAGVNERYGNYEHIGPRWYAVAYGHDDPVEVTVTEDPAGTYHAWIDTKRNGGVPEMIQPNQDLYRMQFTYGPEAEEVKGRGRTVRVHIEPTSTTRPEIDLAYIQPTSTERS